MDLAWEALEVKLHTLTDESPTLMRLQMSRVIYEANSSPENDPLLANVSFHTFLPHLLEEVISSQTYRRLGDLNKHNGDYDAAIIEYQKCLDLRLAFCSDNDRQVLVHSPYGYLRLFFER